MSPLIGPKTARALHDSCPVRSPKAECRWKHQSERHLSPSSDVGVTWQACVGSFAASAPGHHASPSKQRFEHPSKIQPLRSCLVGILNVTPCSLPVMLSVLYTKPALQRWFWNWPSQGSTLARSALDRNSSHNHEMTEIKLWRHKATFHYLLTWANKITQANLLKTPFKTLLGSHLLITVKRLPGTGLSFKGSDHCLTFGWYFLPSRAHSCLLSHVSLPPKERALGHTPRFALIASCLSEGPLGPRLSTWGKRMPGCRGRPVGAASYNHIS